ncbi:type VI secretion system tip protein VgrG [Massilia sp. CCM 8694]|uniref:Type VI secretion system tip protein VgrG n=1 Tax=Massilia genomosp. 1 TaxID=2609280 RepID=A0ABX0N2L4_9BURK|nr:type VI secretion system tip protein VgrG [Massilia genomosp. 1]
MLVNTLEAIEGLSRPFEFTVELLSHDPHVPLKDLQGKMLCVQMVRKDGSMRYFTGRVFGFRLKSVDGGMSFYEARLGPWYQYLSLRKDNYLFHYTTMYQQTASIFGDYGSLADWDWRVQGAADTLTDCCQYDESDRNFLERRWVAAGIVYWFEHTERGHKLVLSDDTTSVAPIDGDPEVPFQRHGGATEEDGLGEWSPSRRVAQGSVALASFDFKAPHPVVTALPSVNQQGDVPNIESYEYTGALGFKEGGRPLAQLRMEEIEAAAKQFDGIGNNRYLMPGRWFRLSGHFDTSGTGDDAQAREFLLVSVTHTASNNYHVKETRESHYENSLTALRKIVPWRAGRDHNSVETKIHGIQTATVVGPEGEEIHTDEYGRVRVQFHWDRAGSNDEKSSAWLRVATPWAGANFGMTAIPRIGTEVLVQFLDGNPNRPIITGMVPNADTMPPWTLPANKTQSGILTRSTPQGSYDNANALRFEDKKGQEQLWLHAEKDQLTEVEHNEDKWVGNDRRKTVDRDETSLIKRDRSETVERDETITVHRDRTETVDHDETITIHNNRSERVDHDEKISIGANRSRTVGKNQKDRIGKNWSINVSKMKTETIGMAYMQNVGMGRLENVGMGYSLNVGMIMSTVVGVDKMTSVGAAYSNSAGTSYTVEAGGDGGSTLHMDADSITLSIGKSSLTLKKSGEITLTGDKLTVIGADNVSIISPNIHNN